MQKINLISKNKGTVDLEVQIETLKKEIDTLKAVTDLKDFEISTLSNNLKKEKDEHNKKIVDKWLDDLANNTPHASNSNEVYINAQSCVQSWKVKLHAYHHFNHK